jgi:MYXO-CTERM domain-containing protein
MKTALLLAVVAGSASAQVVSINVPLTGAAERPAVNTVATGNAALTVDFATNILTYTLTWQNLNNGNGNNISIFAHIHLRNVNSDGTFTDNGPVSIDFGNVLSSGTTGTRNLTTVQAEALWAGRGYVNVHSETFRPGEIRGDIPAGQIPAPGAAALMGVAGLAAFRRRR